MAATIHAILKWNPRPGFNPFAPRGILLWTDVFENPEFPVGSPESYAWWGKISQGEYVGMQPPTDWQTKLNDQIKRGEETHLYMYCDADGGTGTPQSLHVGKVLEVRASQNLVPLDDPHVPTEFYTTKKDEGEANKGKFKKGKLIPYWFKLADIRQVSPSDKDNLWVCDIDGNPERRYEPVEVIPYPCGVIEVEPKSFFDPSDLKDIDWDAWWQESKARILSRELRPAGKPSPLARVIVANQPTDMALCIAPLLQHGRELFFVDPYFSPYNVRFRDALKKFLDYATKERSYPLKRVEYHLAFIRGYRRDPLSLEAFARGCEDEVSRIIPKDLKLLFRRWERRPNGRRPHLRFVLTDLAGVQFEQLDRDNRDSVNTITIVRLEPDQVRDERNSFNPQTGDYDLVDDVCVSREGLIYRKPY